MVVVDTETQLEQAVEQMVNAFIRDADQFKDLAPTFWMSLGRLMAAVHAREGTELVRVIGEVHRSLGAPGDFGYGTVHGDALRKVYDVTIKLQREWMKP